MFARLGRSLHMPRLGRSSKDSPRPGQTSAPAATASPLAGLSVEKLLEADARPAFAVSLDDAAASPSATGVVYANPALRRSAGLAPIFQAARMEHAPLWDWVSAGPPQLTYHGAVWTRTALSQSIVVVHVRSFSPPPSPLVVASPAMPSPAAAVEQRTPPPAETATVAMFDMDLRGRLAGAAPLFYDMCGLQDRGKDAAAMPWQSCVVADDLPALERSIAALITSRQPQMVEVRLQRPWHTVDPDGVRTEAPRWAQLTLMPATLSAEGAAPSFTGCAVDVSLQKWQLGQERQRREEATELCRQQERLMDLTSHEMRNPLTAIVHCTDSIVESLEASLVLNRQQRGGSGSSSGSGSGSGSSGSSDSSGSDTQGEMANHLLECIYNAETVITCANHQRQIVDDVLTLSKLSTGLLRMTPVTADPAQVAREALQMYEVEAHLVDLELSMSVDRSWDELGTPFLDFDPSRIRQVLINLIGNAIKFTKAEPTRQVALTLSVSAHRPPEDPACPVQFVAPLEEGINPRPTDVGPPVFLMFEVRDTGKGLSATEQANLFQRFVQASSETHARYGGSGLGLFISRRLAELQSGQIGLASQPGVGSTFAFYVETFRPRPAALAAALAEALRQRASVKERREARSGGGRRRHGDSFGKRKRLTMAAVDRRLRETPLAPSHAPRGVLVVEDNDINQMVARHGLANKGYAVDTAADGVQALERIRHTDRYRPYADQGAPRFPLLAILMDVEMPVMDGLECTRRIRAMEAEGILVGPRIPIIAVSAIARLEQIAEAKAAGCDDVLVKPYHMNVLCDMLKRVADKMAMQPQSLPAMSNGPEQPAHHGTEKQLSDHQSRALEGPVEPLADK